MEKRKVVFSPAAMAYVAENSGPARAIGYIDRIESYCLGFDLMAQRGHRRDDIRRGLRIVGFERRVTIAFHVQTRTVTIDRILYGGRQVEDAFGAENGSES